MTDALTRQLTARRLRERRELESALARLEQERDAERERARDARSLFEKAFRELDKALAEKRKLVEEVDAVQCTRAEAAEARLAEALALLKSFAGPAAWFDSDGPRLPDSYCVNISLGECRRARALTEPAGEDHA